MICMHSSAILAIVCAWLDLFYCYNRQLSQLSSFSLYRLGGKYFFITSSMSAYSAQRPKTKGNIAAHSYRTSARCITIICDRKFKTCLCCYGLHGLTHHMAEDSRSSGTMKKHFLWIITTQRLLRIYFQFSQNSGL